MLVQRKSTFQTKAQKSGVRHESAHPKFGKHPESNAPVGGHVNETIMQESNGAKYGYDSYMILILQKFHGKVYGETGWHPPLSPNAANDVLGVPNPDQQIDADVEAIYNRREN